MPILVEVGSTDEGPSRLTVAGHSRSKAAGECCSAWNSSMSVH